MLFRSLDPIILTYIFRDGSKEPYKKWLGEARDFARIRGTKEENAKPEFGLDRDRSEDNARLDNVKKHIESLKPEDFGMECCTKNDLLGGTPAENAAITRSILQGERGHKRNAVLLNAGAALYINDKAPTLADGVKLAAELIDSGKAMETLKKLIAVSQKAQAVA